MIPKTIHQIWISDVSPELPDRFKKYRDTWLDKHPNWDYRIWNLQNLDFSPRSHRLFKACQHPAQIADLLRMEILFVHGGVYVDTDFECLRPIDDLLRGVRNFSCSEDGQFLSIGILGAEQRSALFDCVIQNFPDVLGKKPVNVETGPAFFTRTVLEKGFNNDLTVFPREYFYPFNFHTENRELVDLSRSYAVHHYADSWKTPLPRWRRAASRMARILQIRR